MFGGCVWLKSDKNRRADITDIQQSRTVTLWIEKVAEGKKLQFSDRVTAANFRPRRYGCSEFQFWPEQPKTGYFIKPQILYFWKKNSDKKKIYRQVKTHGGIALCYESLTVKTSASDCAGHMPTLCVLHIYLLTYLLTEMTVQWDTPVGAEWASFRRHVKLASTRPTLCPSQKESIVKRPRRVALLQNGAVSSVLNGGGVRRGTNERTNKAVATDRHVWSDSTARRPTGRRHMLSARASARSDSTRQLQDTLHSTPSSPHRSNAIRPSTFYWFTYLVYVSVY